MFGKFRSAMDIIRVTLQMMRPQRPIHALLVSFSRHSYKPISDHGRISNMGRTDAIFSESAGTSYSFSRL